MYIEILKLFLKLNYLINLGVKTEKNLIYFILRKLYIKTNKKRVNDKKIT